MADDFARSPSRVYLSACVRRLVELLAQVADLVVASLFGVPTRFQPVELFALSAISGSNRRDGPWRSRQFRFGLSTALSFFGLPSRYDFSISRRVHLAAQFVDLLRRGVEFHAQVRGGLVDQIDGLVRQLTSGNVAVRQGRGRDQRVVADGHLVVGLVTLARCRAGWRWCLPRSARRRTPAGNDVPAPDPFRCSHGTRPAWWRRSGAVRHGPAWASTYCRRPSSLRPRPRRRWCGSRR